MIQWYIDKDVEYIVEYIVAYIIEKNKYLLKIIMFFLFCVCATVHVWRSENNLEPVFFPPCESQGSNWFIALVPGQVHYWAILLALFYIFKN